MYKMKSFILNYTEEYKIIYYVRHPVTYATSALSQNAKMGIWPEDKDNPPTSNYSERINSISSVFGKENMIIRLFDRKSMIGGDVIVDFLSILECPIDIGKDIAEKINKRSEDNVSLSMEAMLIGKEIGKIAKKMPQSEFAKIFEPILTKIKGSKIKLTKKQMDNLIVKTKNDIEYLHKNFNIVFKKPSTRNCLSNYDLFPLVTFKSIAELIVQLLDVSHPLDKIRVEYSDIQIQPIVGNIITDGMGKIVCKTPPSTVKVSEYIDLEVEIFNNTDVIWKGDVFRPINVSYHWFDTEDNPLVFDGCRTPIPNEGIAPNEPRVIRMRVMTPAQPGVYRLMLTMVQESSAWLETIGFQPFLVDIVIE